MNVFGMLGLLGLGEMEGMKWLCLPLLLPYLA